MSHIPSAAMPHAKPHETSLPVPAVAKKPALPIGALAIGGVLALGGVVTAALLWRSGKSTPATRKPAAQRAKRQAPTKTPKRRRSAKTAAATSA